MKNIEIENNRYEIVTDYKNGFELDVFTEHYTDYFEDYDYLVGDIAYGKLRLKGFYDSNNKKVKKINDIKYLDRYIKVDCASDCRYFVLKKIKCEEK